MTFSSPTVANQNEELFDRSPHFGVRGTWGVGDGAHSVAHPRVLIGAKKTHEVDLLSLAGYKRSVSAHAEGALAITALEPVTLSSGNKVQHMILTLERRHPIARICWWLVRVHDVN